MCVCTHICVGVYIYIYIYIYTHIHALIYGRTHTRVYTCMCIYPTHSVTVWLGTNYNTIASTSTKCDTLFYECNVNLCLSILVIESPKQKGQVQCESMLNNDSRSQKAKCNGNHWFHPPSTNAKWSRHALLVIGSSGPNARCKWVIACQWFTSAMWIYACQCLSSFHQSKKVKFYVNPCLTMIHEAKKPSTKLIYFCHRFTKAKRPVAM